MQFIEGARVFDAEDQEVGRISRVVINPDDGKVTHIVISQGLFSSEEKVIPIDHFQEATEDRAVIFDTVNKLKALQNFEDPEYASAVIGEDIGLPGRRQYYVTKTDKNIPDGTVALRAGARVFSSDNHHVGNVVNVIVDPDTETVTKFVVSQGLLFKTQKVVPASSVVETLEDAVHVSLSAYDLEKLADE